MRGTNRVVLAVAVLMVLAALPAVATTPEDKALSLTAVADNNRSYALRFNNHTTVTMGGAGTAQVVMPPQTEPSVAGRDPGTIFVLDNTASMSHGRITNRAAGNLADGTAVASSHAEDISLQVQGVEITMESLRAESHMNCDGPLTPAEAAAGSLVASLRVDGERVPVGEPNAVRHRVDTPDGLGFVEVAPLSVVANDDGSGWTTTALLITVGTRTPWVASPDEITTEQGVRLGVASTSVECAA